MERDALAELSRERLIELVLGLATRVAELEARLEQPPKTSGYATWSHRLDHPPDEWPVTSRAPDLPMPRYFDSIAGMSSSTSACGPGWLRWSMTTVWSGAHGGGPRKL